MHKTLIALAALISIKASAMTGVDCMIHDKQGKMLNDLGMSMSADHFVYEDIKVETNLNGPFAEAPEVAGPQVKFTVTDSKMNVLAELITTLNDQLNTAILIPAKNVYLHCEKMKME